MAVNTNFIAMTPDSWVQLSQFMPTRKALLIQSLGGALILGFNTNAPTIVNEFGSMPSGLWSSIDVGNGPATFRLDAANDGELCQQAWFGFMPASLIPVVNPPISAPQTASFSNGVPHTFAYAAPVGTLVLVYVMTVATGLPALTCVSAISGAIVDAIGTVVLDGAGDQGMLSCFLFGAPGGADTVTLTVTAGTNARAALWIVSGVTVDAAGSTTTGGPVVTWPTLTSLSTLPENFSFGLIGVGNALGASVTSNSGPVSSVVSVADSPDATLWTFITGAGPAQSNSPVLISVTPTVPLTPVFAETFSYTPSSLVLLTSPIVTVVESFEVVIPPPAPKRFSVALPKLSADAIKALNGLLAEMEQYNESKDEGSHHHADHRDGGG